MFEESIFVAMKRTCFILFFFLSLTAFKASAQDYILMPENFIMHKGDTLKLHLLNVSQFNKQDEFRYDGSNTTKFIFSNGSKKVMNLMTMAKDSAMPIVSFKAENEGLNVIDMTRKSITDDIDRDDFLKILDDEALTQYSEKAKNGSKDSFREKYTWYLKSLVEVEKNSANDFEKPLKDEFEIILKDNPYKGNYGDDIIALINFKGKPIANAVVTLYIKTATGKCFCAKAILR